MERRSLALIIIFLVCSKASLLFHTANESCLKTVGLNDQPNSINFYYAEWQDDGVDHDKYNNQFEFQCAHLSNIERETASQQFDEQSPSTASLLQFFPRSSVSTQNAFDRTRSKIQRSDQRFKFRKVYGLRTWLPVRMPRSLTHTGAILTNNMYQGLLHTFLRHWGDWGQFIADVDNGMTNLANMQYYLNQIAGAANNQDSRNAISDLEQAQQTISVQQFNHLQDNLHDMQIVIYRFLLQNVNDHSYMGRSINNNGQLQEFFRVTDRYGQQRVMVICHSNQLYPSDPNFGDSRNIRTITTIYFLNNANAVSRIVTYTTTTRYPHDELRL